MRILLLLACVGVMAFGVHLFSTSEGDAGKGFAVLVIAIGGVAFIAFKAATALVPGADADDDSDENGWSNDGGGSDRE